MVYLLKMVIFHGELLVITRWYQVKRNNPPQNFNAVGQFRRCLILPHPPMWKGGESNTIRDANHTLEKTTQKKTTWFPSTQTPHLVLNLLHSRWFQGHKHLQTFINLKFWRLCRWMNAFLIGWIACKKNQLMPVDTGAVSVEPPCGGCSASLPHAEDTRWRLSSS